MAAPRTQLAQCRSPTEGGPQIIPEDRLLGRASPDRVGRSGGLAQGRKEWKALPHDWGRGTSICVPPMLSIGLCALVAIQPSIKHRVVSENRATPFFILLDNQ
jgi:hypothetical protein